MMMISDMARLRLGAPVALTSKAAKFGRRLLAGTAIALSVTMAPQAWAQNDSACPRRPVTGGIVAASPEVNLALSIIRAPESSASQVQVARDSCRSQITARSNNRRMYDAYMCVGEANMRLGELAGSPEYPTTAGAACNFRTAGLLAGNREPARRADAYYDQGRALSERARALTGRDARLYLFAARDAFDNAIEYQNTDLLAVRLLARADVNLRLDEPVRAEADIARARTLPASQQTASALVRLIESIRNRDPASPWSSNLVEMARQARDIDRNSAAAASLYGQALFPNVAAREHFEAAIRVATPAEQRFVPDAHYYLSLLDQRAGNYRSAREHAVTAGSGKLEYQRQACLVNLLIGREAVGPYREGNRIEDPALSSLAGYNSCRPGVSPEARLLEGMFWLRRAQSMARAYGTLTGDGSSRWYSAVGQAQIAFSAGRAGLRDETPNVTPAPVCQQQPQPTLNCRLNWPGYENVTLAQALDFGVELGHYFGRSCQDPDPQGRVEARQIFLDYKIFAASGTRRCLPD